MAQPALEPQLIEKAKELRKQGKTLLEIASELGISQGSAANATRGVPKPPSRTDSPNKTPKAENSTKNTQGVYFDAEVRLQELLRSYDIKNADRVVSYISSLGENIYADPRRLQKAMVEQLLTQAKAAAITRHWCSQEALVVPEEAKETKESVGTSSPQRFSVLGDRIVPDPDGVSHLQALQELEVRLARESKPGGSSDEVSSLRDEVKSLRQHLEDERMVSIAKTVIHLSTAVEKLDERISKGLSGKSEMDIIHEIATRGMDELGNVRADMKGWLSSQTLPPKKTPQEMEERKGRFTKAIQVDEQIEALGKKLFFGEPEPAAAEAIAPAPAKESSGH